MENRTEKLSALKDFLRKSSKAYEKVDAVIGFILEDRGKTSVDSTFSTKEIIEAYNELKKEFHGSQEEDIVEIPTNTIAVLLSNLSKLETSKINCPGKKRGYYVSLDTTVADVTPEDDGPEIESEAEQKKNKQNEKRLYPIVMQWLADKVDRVADISSLRGRHAKWQNPDILGITFKELLGQEILELTTVEVKPSMDSWQQYIFEAVSHSMFVHRAYFAFLHSSEEKIPEEMKLYASRFGVGLLSLELDKGDLDRFNAGEKIDIDDLEKVEIAPAQTKIPSIDLENRFLHGLSVKDSEDSRSEHSVRTTFDLRKIGVSVQELLLSAKSAQKWPVFFFH